MLYVATTRAADYLILSAGVEEPGKALQVLRGAPDGHGQVAVRGVHFDDLDDLFLAHVGGFDTYALAFKIARRILAEGKFEQFVANRYASYDAGFGRDIEKGKVGFPELERLVLAKLGEPQPRSAKQEYLENLLAQYVARGG